jgi:hypothetical protein
MKSALNWWTGRGSTAHGDSAHLLGELTRYLFNGCDTIIDSSKEPGIVRLHSSAGVACRIDVVHIVRDLASTIASVRHRPLRRPEVLGPERTLPSFPAGRVTGRWVAHNLWCESFAQDATIAYQRVRLEDLVTDPAVYISGLRTALGLPPRLSPRSEPDHTLRGNPMRFEPLRVDASRAGQAAPLPLRERLLVAAALPFRHRYGY